MVLAGERVALFVVDDQALKKACDSERGPCRKQLRWVGGRCRKGFLLHRVAAQLPWGDGGVPWLPTHLTEMLSFNTELS